MNSLTRRAFVSATSTALLAQSQRPNVLYIMADDFGFECMSGNGGTSYKTPNLDAFARSGVRFTHAFAQPLCTPTRLQLMTGQLNFRNYKSFGTMDPKEKTFGHMMQRAGYKTFITGKWQLFSYDAPPSKYRGTGMRPEQSGFDEFVLWHDAYSEDKGSRYGKPKINKNGKMMTGIDDKYGPDIFSDALIDFMTRNKNTPFFAYYPMALTHGPFNTTPMSADWKTADRVKDNPAYFPDMVRYLDMEMGKILKAVDRLGLAENTLIVFYSDNGSPPEITSKLGTRVVPGGKRMTTEAGMRVPMMARWRGKTPEGRVCDDLIDSTDFLPTLMEATGAKWFDGLPVDGRSFLPQVKGEKGNPRQALFAHFDPHPSCKADLTPTRLVWDHQWKLYIDGRLYDWKADPMEAKPVTKGGEAARKKLQAVLDHYAKVKAPKFNRFEPDGKPAY
ncbi:MAG: arylsulfatase [Acidobacteria bacterium]|nr:arylsulfatase [Acidobacteriota bacterium]